MVMFYTLDGGALSWKYVKKVVVLSWSTMQA